MAGGGTVQVVINADGINPNGTDLLPTISTLVKAFVGAGALSLSLLFYQGGVIAATAFLFSLSAIALYAIFCLVDITDYILKTEARRNMVTRLKRQKDKNAPAAMLFEVYPGATDDDLLPEDYNGLEAPNFAQCANVAVGRWGAAFINLCIVITQCGITIAYVIFIASNFHQVLGGLSLVGWKVAITVPIGALLLIPDLSKLAFVGVLGNIVYLITIALIFYVGLKDYCCVSYDDLNLNDTSYYPMIFGTVSFSLEGIVLCQVAKPKMKDSRKFPFAMTIAMGIVAGIYFIVGLGGYLMFGNQTKSPILDVLPPKLFVSKFARLALSTSLFFTFPFQFYPITEYLLSLLNAHYKTDAASLHRTKLYCGMYDAELTEGGIGTDNNNGYTTEVEEVDNSYLKSMEEAEVNQKKVYWWSVLLRFIVLGVIVFTAIVFPDFKLIIAFFGSFANSSLAYMAPAAFWICTIAMGGRFVRNSEYFNPRSDSLRESLLSANATTTTSGGNQQDPLQFLDDSSQTPVSLTEIKETLCTGKVNISTADNNRATFKDVFFPLNTMYFRDRKGNKIDVNTILLHNIRVVGEYLKDEKAGLHSTQYNIQQSFDGPNETTALSNTSTRAYGATDDNHNREVLDSKELKKLQTLYQFIPTSEFLIRWVLFPIIVVVLGVTASCIGVVDSVKDIIDQFGK